MKKCVPVIFFLLLGLAACSLKPDHFVVSGTIANANGGKLYIEILTGTSAVAVDSVVLDEKGKFKMEVKAVDAGFYSLNLDHKRSITLAAVPGEKIEINASANDMNSNYTVNGSRDSELVRVLEISLNQTLNKMKALSNTYYDSLQSPRILVIKKNLDSMYTSLVNDHRQTTIQFIKDNPASLASLMALYQQVPSSNPMQTDLLIDPMKNISLYERVDSMMMIKYPGSEPVILLHKQMIGYRDDKKEFDRVSLTTAIGRKAPDIVLLSDKGDSIRLSSLRGKYVLLNFWASWSDESRKLNAQLKSLYSKYRWDGFEIFQVSLDKSKEAWLNAIAEDKISWKNGCDFQFWNSPVAAKYNVRQLPVSFLIDREGKIMEKDISLEQLKSNLKTFFKY